MSNDDAERKQRMTPQMIAEEVDEMRKHDDPEAGHMQRDSLWWRVLEAIADGKCADPIACARAALEADEAVPETWHS